MRCRAGPVAISHKNSDARQERNSTDAKRASKGHRGLRKGTKSQGRSARDDGAATKEAERDRLLCGTAIREITRR